MNVLFGLYQPDEGEILLDDEPRHFTGPGEAMAAGIGMVHQHFMLIPVFTVAENVMLGHEPTRFGQVLDLADGRAKRCARSRRGSASTLDPDALVEDLPVGVQQRVEIVKALSRDAKVLVLDEPTAVLTPQETDELMVDDAASSPTPAPRSSSSPTSCARSRPSPTASPSSASARSSDRPSRRHRPTNSPRSWWAATSNSPSTKNAAEARRRACSSVEDLTLFSIPAASACSTTSRSSIRAGEVLAHRGGAGQRSDRTHRGDRRACARSCRARSGSTARRLLGHSVRRHPRRRASASCPKTARKTASSPSSPSPRTSCSTAASTGPSRRGSTSTSPTATTSPHGDREFDIRTPDAETPVGRLSGGNQQKVVLARELVAATSSCSSRRSRPVASTSARSSSSTSASSRCATRGVPVLIISTELDEVHRPRRPHRRDVPRRDRRHRRPPTRRARSSAS